MKKRKILHLITHTAVGGSQDNTFCTCALHDRARFEVHLASHPGGPWAERARSSCDVFHALPTPKGPWFLGCGRLTAQKDFSTLIRAFARLQHECGAALWILGEGELRGKLEREIAALGLGSRVRLPGFVKNPFACMARASAFVLSSQWEGFGNVVTEAMACGTPVIATDCPHGPREILEDGKWGSLVPVANVDALADAMRAALANPEQQQARATAARSHVTRFEAGRITRQYEQAILSALSQRQETSKQP